jgi:UDP-N-acetylmuramoyl-L-alanyl-D-glutamate--2,6-diaminopimelate ligase
MGEIAARLADCVWLTSDNPRSEDPVAVIADIARGIERAHEVEPLRERAIQKAVRAAVKNDVLLIAGKGHEEYQEIAGRRLPFSDAAVARAALARASDA